MAIKIRRGNKADLVTANLSIGEPVLATDTKEVGIMGSSGTMIWIATKDLINVANGIAGLDSSGKVPIANVNGGVANTQKIAGITLSGDITAAQLHAAGLAAGDSSGNANNALELGGILASLYPTISSGTWTPTLFGTTTAGSPVFTASQNNYIKIGNLVYLECTLTLSSLGGMTGRIMVGGVPFAATAYSNIATPSCDNISLPSANKISGIINPGTTAFFVAIQGQTGFLGLTEANITATTILRFCGFYHA